ncbi:SMI1/KNR4 family protein [Streptomyces sp. NPDC001634]|uniref:SMI1/KNR4 family protein n=1 Tax=Streptomyces sp. NPDC001634 TaxID=3154390 RepID=UPI003318FA53
MTTDLVVNSWDRMDSWLREHAPRTFASLGPPATEEEIRAAEEELDVTFHPDLVASLLRHNGAQGGEAAFRFTTHDRLLGVREIVGMSRALRDLSTDLDEEFADYYWHHDYLKFGSYDVTADGLTIDCRPGRDSYGAIGRFFDETGTDFGHAESLGACLAALADRLEGPRTALSRGASPVAFNGRLIWAEAAAPRPEWGSADDPLPRAPTDLQPLELPSDPAEPLRAVYLHGLQELGALVATLPRERVAEAARKQMRRLAVETGLAKYAEVTAALDAMERGEAVPMGQDSPLSLRLRTVIAEATAHRDDLRRWAAENMVDAVWGVPHRAVKKIANTRGHLSVDWRAELLADFDNPSIPPMPDDLFWAGLRNPDIDSSWYAARCAQDHRQASKRGREVSM